MAKFISYQLVAILTQSIIGLKNIFNQLIGIENFSIN